MRPSQFPSCKSTLPIQTVSGGAGAAVARVSSLKGIIYAGPIESPINEKVVFFQENQQVFI